MSVLTSFRRGARTAVERSLRKNARAVKRVLLATGRDRAPLPEIVQIESTNICNARCVFCPRDDMERRQGIMDMALFRKVADECAALGIEHVRMHNYGEPFVDRQLVEKVRYAKQAGIPQVGMISNGSLITETAAKGMIDAGLDAINISVDASGKETFEKTVTGDGIVLVDWWAAWCGPCRSFAPVFEGASQEHPDITFAKIDTEAEPELSMAARISSIPTLMAFRDGILVYSEPGALPATALNQLIAAVRDLDMTEVRAKVAATSARPTSSSVMPGFW